VVNDVMFAHKGQSKTKFTTWRHWGKVSYLWLPCFW